METFVIVINSVRVNPDNLEELMTPPPSTGSGGPRAGGPAGRPRRPWHPEKLAEGVTASPAGHVSLAVEFKDYVVAFSKPARTKRAAWPS
jgi:hypothetical protein